MTFRTASAAVMVALLALVVPRTSLAQSDEAGLSVAIAAGPTLNDLETGGTDWLFVAGLEWRPGTGPVVVQLDARYLTYELAEREHLVMPEATVELEMAVGPLRPFAGAGPGFHIAVRPGDNASSVTYHAAAGTRVRMTDAIALRLEARARSVDPFITLTAGLAWQL